MNASQKHSRCVPLEIYQKVFDDRKKLKLELEEINNKLQINNKKEKKNLIIYSYENELKNIQKEKGNLEIVNQNQKKNLNNLKNIIMKYEKELNIKDIYINELKSTIKDLNIKMKNVKEELKKERKKEIIKLNEQINKLQNELEIKDQKTEVIKIKFNNLQLKYLKLVHNKKKEEQDNLLKQSINQLNKKIKNNHNNTNLNLKKSLDTLNDDVNILLPLIEKNQRLLKMMKREI